MSILFGETKVLKSYNLNKHCLFKTSFFNDKITVSCIEEHYFYFHYAA